MNIYQKSATASVRSRNSSLIIYCGVLLISLLFSGRIWGQEEDAFVIPKQTEFVIPPSPAYQMLDATSSLVNSPGTIRDFKVDWSFKTYRLAPNLAIEAQPVWSILYNRPTLERYQRAGKFMQTLSTLSLSLGSLDANDTSRLCAWAGKITLYRGYDPLASGEWFEDIRAEYEAQRQDIETRLIEARAKFKEETGRFAKDSLEQIVYQLRDELDNLKLSQKSKIKERQESLKARYWNRTTVDVAFGRSYSFNRGITERIDSIEFKNEGISLWLNGAFGLGRYILVTGLVRGEDFFTSIADSGKVTLQDILIDKFSGDTIISDRDSLFVNFNSVKKKVLSVGLNFRFGSPRYNFFVEGFYTQSRIPTFEDTEWSDYTYGVGSKGRKRTAQIQEQLLVAFGGEWRVSNSVLLSYGIRSVVDKHLKFRNIVPLASISCLMR
jgi:hypothetical protein